MDKLTPMQELWIEHYITTLNATEAARLAGYKGGATALRVAGNRNKSNANICLHLAKRIHKKMQKLDIESDRVLEAFRNGAFADIRDYVQWSNDKVTLVASDKLTDSQAAAVKARGVRLGKRPKLFAKDIVPLLENGYTISQLAAELGKSRVAVYNALKREDIDIKEIRA